jgi:hypothetical protein
MKFNLINKITLGILIASIVFVFIFFPIQYKNLVHKNYLKIEKHTDTISINQNTYVCYKLDDGKTYLLNIEDKETNRIQILKDVLFETYLQKDEIEIKNITIKSAIQRAETNEKPDQLNNDDEYIKLKYLNIYNEAQADTLRAFIGSLKKELLK